MTRPDPSNSPPASTLDAFLGGRLMLRQPCDGYRAGLDAMLLAATVPGSDPGPATIVDLGAGVGALGLAAAVRVPSLQVVLVEREPVLVRMCAENIERNDLGRRARAVNADIEANSALLDDAGLAADLFDHVLANPPFQVEGNGRTPPDRLKAGAHVMPAGGIERWVRSCARLARPGGTATLIHRAEALPELLAAFGGRFGGMVVLPVHPRRGEAAVRVIVAGRKGSRAPMRLLPGLVVHNDDGHAFTPMLDAILQHGAGLDLWSARAPALVGAAGIA